MVKKLILLLLLSISVCLWGGGNKEISLPVPEKASWVIGLNLHSLINNSFADSLFSLFPFFEAYGISDNSNMNGFSNILEKTMGFGLMDINRFFMWGNDFHLPNEAAAYGYIIEADNNDAHFLLEKIKSKRKFSTSFISKTEILTFSFNGNPLSFMEIGPYLCFSEDIEILAMMINSNLNNNSIKSNQDLYPLFQKYNHGSLFLISDLRKNHAEWLVPPLDMIELCAGSILIKDNLLVNAEMIEGSKKSATQFYNLFVLSINLISQFVPPEREDIKSAYKFLMSSFNIEHDANKVILSVQYDNEVIMHLQNLIDLFMDMLYAGYL